MVPICIQISFECFHFLFEWLESLSNGSNLHLIASNLVRMHPICIRMVRIPVEWFQIAFECFQLAFEWLESLLNGSNLHSIASTLVRMHPICIRMVRIPVELFEFAFDCFESRSNASNLHSNG